MASLRFVKRIVRQAKENAYRIRTPASEDVPASSVAPKKLSALEIEDVKDRIRKLRETLKP